MLCYADLVILVRLVLRPVYNSQLREFYSTVQPRSQGQTLGTRLSTVLVITHPRTMVLCIILS
jgi:hypothetical protein